MNQLSFFESKEQSQPRPKTSIIYIPKGRAREYSPLACNLYSGCGHRCSYCYAPSAVRKSSEDFYQPAPRANIIDKIKSDAIRLSRSGHVGQVLLCFTCDPYQPIDANLGLARQAIQVLHEYGFTVQVLTKGGRRALRDIDLFTGKDAFASTLTFISESDSLEWEPNAATPSDRFDTLRQFHAAGIPTWASLEPVIDPEQSLEIIRQTHPFVDLYKVGKLNYHPIASAIDWASFAHRAVALLKRLGKPYYIKKDLERYLSNTPA